MLPTATCLQHLREAPVPEELIKTNMSDTMCMCARTNQREYSPTKHKHAIARIWLPICAGEIVSLAAVCVQYGGLQSEVMHYVMHTVNSTSGQ